jgi:hypothetical protein
MDLHLLSVKSDESTWMTVDDEECIMQMSDDELIALLQTDKWNFGCNSNEIFIFRDERMPVISWVYSHMYLQNECICIDTPSNHTHKMSISI